jgi:hypothetical protein
MLVLQVYRIQELWEVMRLPPRFQRKTWEARQHVAVLEPLQAVPKSIMHESMRVKPKIQWRP